MKTGLIISITVIFLCSICDGQTWRKCSPPDRTFQVELPVPCPSPSYVGSQGPSSIIGPTTDPGVTIFLAPQKGENSRSFKIEKLEAPRSFLDGPKRVAALNGLDMEIGGDDAIPSKVASFSDRGLKVTEYFYAKRASSGWFARGRIIDAGNVVYVLSVKTLSSKDIYSSDVACFLNSFRVLGKKARRAEQERS